MGSDLPQKKTYSFIEGSKEHLAFKELKKGDEFYQAHNYNEANEHYIKSLLFNYDNFAHNNLSISLGKYCVNCLKEKKLNDIVPYSLMIEQDELVRDSFSKQLKNEYVISHNEGNYGESLKYLVQSHLIKPNNNIKEDILDLCYKDFTKNFKKNVESLETNENIKEKLNLLSSKKKDLNEYFATYLNNKGADYSYCHKDIMAKKYIDLANLLSNNGVIISNENIANKNLKISKNSEYMDNYTIDEEYKKDKKLLEIFKNLNISDNGDNIIDKWIRENEIKYNKNNFPHIIEEFNKSKYQKILEELKNKSIDILNSILNSIINKDSYENNCVIGKSILNILYIELDYKNWIINVGVEYSSSLYKLLKKILKFGNTISVDYYAEININLKPKSLKDIFDYDYGVFVGKNLETPLFYTSTGISKSFRNNEDNEN